MSDATFFYFSGLKAKHLRKKELLIDEVLIGDN